MQDVLDVPNEVAAELAGIGDGVLTALRERLGCKVNLRGNRVTLEGDDTKVAEARAVIEEIVELVEGGQEIGAGMVDTIVNALKGSEKELQRPLSDDEELQVLQRERKKRVEAAEAFRSGGREEQAATEERELAILEEFMPEPLSEEEIEEIIDDAIAEVGATSMADLGRVMADVMPQIAGRADGSTVSQIVREKLA